MFWMLIIVCRGIKLHYFRIFVALFALFLSHVATATLLHHKTKITQRYAIPALTNIGERGLSFLQRYYHYQEEILLIVRAPIFNISIVCSRRKKGNNTSIIGEKGKSPAIKLIIY